VPGVGHSPDKMLQARVFSYADAHRYRVGVNAEQLSVNKPRCPVHTYHADGAMRLAGHGNADAYYDRGLALRRGGDTDRAIADLSEAVRLNPQLAAAFNERGYAFGQKHDMARAIADYTEAIRLNPQFAIAYNNRGNAYDDKGDPGHAIADYTEALRIDASYSSAYYNRGIAWRRKGDLDRAIADYDQAIKISPTAAAYNNRGSVYRAQGDLDLALADFDKLIANRAPILAVDENPPGDSGHDFTPNLAHLAHQALAARHHSAIAAPDDQHPDTDKDRRQRQRRPGDQSAAHVQIGL